MPIVQLPDGTLVELPDTEASPSTGDKLLRQAKLTASNVLQGVAGLPGLAIDLGRTAAAKFPELTSSKPSRPDHKFGDTLTGIQGGAEALTGVKPESLGEQRAASVVQGVAGALGPAAAAGPVRAVIAGALGGAGAQFGNEVSKGNPLVQLLGGLVGGGVGAGIGNFVGGVRPQMRKIAQDATEGLTPDQLSAAANFQRLAQKKGVDVDLAQALDAMGHPSTNLGTIRDLLAGTNAGNKTQQTLRGQPTQFQARADLELLKFPGSVMPPTEASNAVQKAATNAIGAAKRDRTAAVEPFYKQAGYQAPAINTGLSNLLMEARIRPGVPESAVAAIDSTLAKMKKNPATDAKMDHALDFNQAIRELQGPFKGTPLTPADPIAKHHIDKLAESMREFLRMTNPEIRAGDAKYAQISRTHVDPLKQSVVGRMATKRGYLADTEAAPARLEALFVRGTDPKARTSEILTLAKELNAQDSTAFPNAAKTYLSGRLAKAFEPEINGVPGASANAAEKIWKSLFADKSQYRGIRDMAAGVADAYKLPRKDVVDGIETLALLAKALKNRPVLGVGGLDPQDVRRIAGSNQAANVTRIYGFLPFERVARKIEDAQLQKTFGHFDELLTSPEGAEILAKIGRKGVMSPETLVLLAGFKGGATAGILPNIITP